MLQGWQDHHLQDYCVVGWVETHEAPPIDSLSRKIVSPVRHRRVLAIEHVQCYSQLQGRIQQWRFMPELQ